MSESKEPEAIEDVLRRWLSRNRARSRVDPEKIFLRWSEIVGEDFAAHTRVVDLRSGILHVEVDSGPLLHELSTYHAQEILESVRQEEGFQNVRDIRFRAGSPGDPG